MPPKKKGKTGGAAAAKPATKSPCAAYFERLNTAVDSNSGLGKCVHNKPVTNVTLTLFLSLVVSATFYLC